MAQNFVGANNIELLEPIGQFGSRILGGEDSAQPRYIHTHLSRNVEQLFNPLDENVYDYNFDDTLRVEPKYYVPLLPMILVNGCNGIGTGWSSDIPQYNPRNICENIRTYINNPSAELKPLTPYYRGFTGSIIKVDDTHFISRGIFEKTKKNQIRVTELPVGLWTERFKEHIEGLIFDTKATPAKIKKQFIRNYTSYSTDTVVDFYIDIEQSRIDAMTSKVDEHGITELETALNLVSKINTNNMNYYNRHHQISNTSDPNVILKEFCEVKMETNAKRREYQMSVLTSNIGNLEVKIRFINDFIAGKIKIASKKKVEIEGQLKSLGYPVSEREGDYMYLLRMPMYNLTLEKISEFSDKMEEMQHELAELNETTPSIMWMEELSVFAPKKVKIMKKK
jgi:DNA topoisomerase-2